MNWKQLAEPFAPEDIEWRPQRTGKKGDGQWAMLLAYITNRAIMQRLDDVCGPDCWKNEYLAAPTGGVLCGISIKIGDEWITKYDGAENTQIEEVKGGLSSAMKRAAVQWGIGRYLYNLETTYADVQANKVKDGHFIDDKKTGVKGYFLPPQLPGWALPGGVKAVSDNVRVTNGSKRQADMTKATKLEGDKYTIKKVTTKTGTNKNGAWTLYQIHTNDGLTVSTFKADFGKLAQKLSGTDNIVVLEHRKTEKGGHELLNMIERDPSGSMEGAPFQ